MTSVVLKVLKQWNVQDLEISKELRIWRESQLWLSYKLWHNWSSSLRTSSVLVSPSFTRLFFQSFAIFADEKLGAKSDVLYSLLFMARDKLLLHRDQCRPSAGSQSFSFGPYSSTIHWQKSFHRLVHSTVTLFSSSGAIQLCSRLHFASCFQPSKVIDSDPIMTW